MFFYVLRFVLLVYFFILIFDTFEEKMINSAYY